MKCQVTSTEIRDVLISKQISYKSFKEICGGEKKKVNLGYWGDWDGFIVENNSMVHIPLREDFPEQNIYGKSSAMPFNWEVLSKFFSHHNIEPNWLDCNYTYGHYDEDLGGWTGCMGQVWGTEYWMWWLSQIIRLRGMRLTLSLTEATVVYPHEEK